MGHIKFWRMASTFTGLKLQGYLGKFGASELTDISAFIQLPDGKVLSSTETGNLLLWDGGLIKCELSDKGRKPCHAGRIDVILMVDNEVYTAGEDGYVRVWDFETIDNADVTSPAAGSGGGDGTGGAPVSSSGPLQVRVFEMEFLDEFLIGKDAKIRTMVRSLENPTEYYIQDTQGHLLKLDTNKRTVDRLLSFHSGAVVAADASPLRHSLLSLGSDGTLRLYDYQNKAVLFRQRFPCGGSSLTYLPDLLDVRGLTFAAGFSDGVLRIMSHEAIYDATNVELKLHYAFKPHKGSVSSIAISSDGGYLATTGAEDRCVFFFRLEPAAGNASEDDAFTSGDGQQQPLVFGRGAVSVTPLGFVELEASATCVSFSPDNHLYLQDFEPAAAGTGSDDSGDGGSGGGSQRSSRVDRSDLGSEEGSRDSEGGGEGRRGRDAEPEIDGKRTMVVLSDGLMLSMVVPSSNDSRVTYQLELESLQVKRWQLKVPPPPKEEEKGDAANGSDGKATSGGDGSPAAAAQSAPPPATAAGAAAGPAEDGKGEKDNPSRLMSALRRKRGLVIVDESPVTLALYLEGGYFLVALVNKFGEGEIRSCKFDDPTMSRLLLVYKAPFTDLRLTASGKYLLAGTLDGMTFLRKIRLEDMLLHGWTLGHETYEHYSISFEEQLAEKELQKRAVIESSSAQQETTGTAAPRVMSTAGPNRDEEAGQYWYGHAHDCDRGRVNSLVTSFDDAFLCSAGSDGGLFVWRLTHVDVQESQGLISCVNGERF
ncbi:WD40-repeat-containing domain protein [Zopfochytrium polystomum]|nr:WD40-repeat-containing domain protein [Zopfochytrium polystomum]